MSKLRFPRRSWLFYRNALIAWGFILFVFGFSFSMPSNLVSLLLVIILSLLAYLIWTNFLYAHPPRLFAMRNITPAVVDLPYETVEFKSRDGINLFGFCIPGKNGKAIILAHGRGSSCSDLILHAEALYKKGYCVLLFDLRAHGHSEGDTCTLGILEAQDVLGAVDYLQTRQDIDPKHLGVLGISLGAQAVLRAALSGDEINALVLEGLGPSSVEDHGARPTTLRQRIIYLINQIFYSFGDFMIGQPQPESTTSVISRISRPVLLITAGRGGEKLLGSRFYAAAKEPKMLWENPDAHHAAVFFKNRVEYQQRVSQFFDRALSVENATEINNE